VHRRQWDMAGGHGPIVPYGLPCHWSAWYARCTSRSHHHARSMSVWSKDGGWAPTDPWAHCHPLGGAKLTSKSPSRLWQLTYLHATTIQRPSITIGWWGGGMDDRPMALDIAQRLSHPKLPHLSLQVPPFPLHTIKGVVVLGGYHHSAALKYYKCSKLSEALQEQ